MSAMTAQARGRTPGRPKSNTGSYKHIGRAPGQPVDITPKVCLASAKPRPGQPGREVRGTVGDMLFTAEVYGEPSPFGLYGGRVSQLFLSGPDGRHLYEWTRGPSMPCDDPRVRAAVEAIADEFTHPDDPPHTAPHPDITYYTDHLYPSELAATHNDLLASGLPTGDVVAAMVVAAKRLGAAAFDQGTSRIPAMDPKLRPLLDGPVGTPGAEVLEAWLDGWEQRAKATGYFDVQDEEQQ